MKVIARLPMSAWGFFKGALKRDAWLWCVTAVLGLVVCAGLYAKFLPAKQATTSVLLTNNPSQDPANQIAADVALSQSPAVAGRPPISLA
jgi:hypothetical protein